MSRLVRHDRNRPYEVKPEDPNKSIWICACGLS
ncbi:MAG: iron-binding protein, partial [Bacillota bacterium]